MVAQINAQIESAQEKLAELLIGEFERIENMKNNSAPVDFSAADTIVIGVMPGDGIGPVITDQALRVLRRLMAEELDSGKLRIRMIDGMTIERRSELNQSLPDDVLRACLECDVLLKGPFVTPTAVDPWPNLVSANSLLRRALDLFAAVRPIRIPERGIDWCFFRENIEGEYLWGNKGVQVNEDLCFDFKVATVPGCRRIARAAFDYAKKNGKHNVTVITKANIVKLCDGTFLREVHNIGRSEYPDIEVKEMLVDSAAAKLMDPQFTKGCDVFVMPNLYGDIITDIAAEFQGGLGTASSSNIGSKHAMFEAVHGIGSHLVKTHQEQYADPCSLIRAVGEMLAHIGYPQQKGKLNRALDACLATAQARTPSASDEGMTAEQFTDLLLDTLGRI